MNRGDQLTLWHVVRPAPDAVDMHRYCRDCAADTYGGEWYIVRAEVWPLAPDGGVLCIGCLEWRIGRRLTPSDFPKVGINDPDDPWAPWWGPRSRRLLDRMGMAIDA